jgi:putrescine transport system substrate-binding protein
MRVRALSPLLSALLLLTAGCQPPSGGDATPGAKGVDSEEKVLAIYNWDNYIDPEVLKAFTAETGIEVVYDNFDSSELLESKLLTGGTGYDLVVPGAPFLGRQIQAGVFQPLDRSKLDQWKNLDPKTLELLGSFDPGNRHAIPYLWGTTGLGMNRAKVLAALGEDAPLDSYDLIFKPEYMQKLQSCGVAFLDAPGEVEAAALNYLGKSPGSQTAADYEAVEALLLSVRPYVRYFSDTQQAGDLASGEICLAMGWSGDMAQAAARAKEANAGVELSYVIPREGTEVWIDTMAIPKDAPHPGNAHRFLNYLLRPEVIAKITNFVAYPNGNLASYPMVAKEITEDPSIYPDPDVQKRLYTVHVLPQETDRVITRVWTKVKTGH